MEQIDVIVVGAGLSGIGAGYHLQTRSPSRSYAILEGRGASGGTWDLFRYPGIRSDSDMHTLGYAFKPWRGAKAIADGRAILDYVREAAAEHGIERHIRYDHRVVAAAWSTAEARWTLTVRHGDQTSQIVCGFLFLCSGYYDYAAGHAPDFAGVDAFRGTLVHPQHWPEALDYAGKRVIVIGSGATAVTLVPELAKQAAHVTMLQRSPTYIVSRPSADRIADRLRRLLPARAAYAITRWKNVLLGMLFFTLSRRRPAKMKAKLIDLVRGEMGADYDVATHFTPRYDPWDQRLCLVPDGDLFTAMRAGTVSITTGHIDRFTRDGIRLASGETLPADIVVTATGLNLKLLGGIALTVDGAPVDLARTMSYKGMMFSDVPNLALSFGYTNASWTLKSDLTAGYVCRLLNAMERRGLRQCTPRPGGAAIAEAPWLDFTSGYVQRSIDLLPKQGDRPPWKLHQNYVRDLAMLKFGRLDDGTMIFSNPAARP